MKGASAALTDTILQASPRRVAFLGLAKNVGKTTALVATLAELHRRGLVAGATSAGRDGEQFDAITGEPKPRFRVWPGQLIASASSTFDAASFASTPLAALSFHTRFGPVLLHRAEADGEIEMIGPSTASEIAATATALEEAGAQIVLLDGAVGRRAFACGRVADGIVLSVGLAAADSLEGAVSAARAAVELIRLGAPAPGARLRAFDGALTDLSLRENPPRSGDVLVAEDFASIFLSAADRRRLEQEGVCLAVRRPARLLAVTANPTAPARAPLAAARFFDAIRAAIPATPLFDLVADLESPGP